MHFYIITYILNFYVYLLVFIQKKFNMTNIFISLFIFFIISILYIVCFVNFPDFFCFIV